MDNDNKPVGDEKTTLKGPESEEEINPFGDIKDLGDLDESENQHEELDIEELPTNSLEAKVKASQKTQGKNFLEKPVNEYLKDIDNSSYFPLFEKIRQLINIEEVFESIAHKEPRSPEPTLEEDLFDYAMLKFILEYAKAAPEDRLVNKDGEIKIDLTRDIYRVLDERLSGIQEEIIEARYGSLLKDIYLQIKKNDIKKLIERTEKKEWLHKVIGGASALATPILTYAGITCKNIGEHGWADILLYAAAPAGFLSIGAGFIVPAIFSRKRKKLEEEFYECDKQMGEQKTETIIDQINSELKGIKSRLGDY